MAEHYTTKHKVVDPVCDTHEPETPILRETETVQLYVPRYDTCTSIVATGKEGSAPGELNTPSGVAIHEDTHQIFIANHYNHRVEIFSEMGEFLYQLGIGQLSRPYGIALHGDIVYVSCWGDHTVSKFSLNEMYLVRRIGGRGSNIKQLCFPYQLTTDYIGRVFTADYYHRRICIHDPDLNHLHNITLQFMSVPYDVKVSHDRIYVLCPYINTYIHVLTLEGDKLHSPITSREGMDLITPNFFCFDPLSNFVMSDYESHSIRVLSPEGNLLRTIGREGHQQGMFYYPRGVAVTPNRNLVCVSSNENCGLQIFHKLFVCN